MTELPVTSYGRKVAGEKSRVASLVLSFFIFAGIGVMYAGNLRKGLVFFIIDILMLVVVIISTVVISVSSVAMAASMVSSGSPELDAAAGLGGILVPFIFICIAPLVSLILKIVSMVSGYNMCTENNQLWIEYLEHQ